MLKRVVEKKKNKPDYTKFMKKPAPLGPIEPSTEVEYDSKPESTLEEDIPLAEILSSQDENGPDELTDIRHFETISEEEHWSSGHSHETVSITQPIPDFSDVTDSGSPEPRSSVVLPDSSDINRLTDNAQDIGILAQQFCAFQPPPVPVFIAPILLALLFLAF